MGDEVVEALRELSAGMRRNAQRIEEVLTRAERMCREREAGKPWRDIVREEDRPLIVEIIGQNLDELYASGGRLRRAQAKALHEEGLTMEQIARLFGVTRQRVSALLRAADDRPAD
ncbi:MAG TPA: helix-turn-helix domain-containing protein [Acidimicrobiales bacterium]